MDTKNESRLVFETDLRLEDFRDLNRIKTRGAINLFSFVAAVFLCATFYFKFPQYLWVVVAGAIAVLFLFRALGRLYIRWQSGRIYARANVSDRLRLVLTDQGVTQYANAGETQLLWGNVHRVRASRDCYFVFLNASQAFYFPKRSFKTKADEDAFCELLIRSVPANKLKF